MDFKAKYVSKEDFLQIKGLNLDIELGVSDDNANESSRYIANVERKIINYLIVNYHFVETDINEKNLDRFKLAVIEQIDYELINGVNSEISDTTKIYLRASGLMNIMTLRVPKNWRWY